MSQTSPPAACILVVAPDATLLGSLQEMLRIRLQGVEVVTCHSAAGALRKPEERDYDVVVTDIRLQGTEGLELLAQLQQRSPQTPTILMSSYENYFLVMRALASYQQSQLQPMPKKKKWDRLLSPATSFSGPSPLT